MLVKAEWLQLRIAQYEDGTYEAYDDLSDERFESDSWLEVSEWVTQLLRDIGDGKC